MVPTVCRRVKQEKKQLERNAVVIGLALTLAVLCPTTGTRTNAVEATAAFQQNANSNAEAPSQRAAAFTMEEAAEFDQTINHRSNARTVLAQTAGLHFERYTPQSAKTAASLPGYPRDERSMKTALTITIALISWMSSAPVFG